MRWVRIIAVCLVASLGLGCFVLNEIDSGQKELDRYGHTQTNSPPAAAPATGSAKKAQPGTSSTAAWWQKAHTLSSDKMDETITSCRIRGHVEYMRKSDCAARGGAAG
jgi:hypothetical protein